jgi:hypothetical protein
MKFESNRASTFSGDGRATVSKVGETENHRFRSLVIFCRRLAQVRESVRNRPISSFSKHFPKKKPAIWRLRASEIF